MFSVEVRPVGEKLGDIRIGTMESVLYRFGFVPVTKECVGVLCYFERVNYTPPPFFEHIQHRTRLLSSEKSFEFREMFAVCAKFFALRDSCCEPMSGFSGFPALQGLSGTAYRRVDVRIGLPWGQSFPEFGTLS
jgi:hypothetical protein